MAIHVRKDTSIDSLNINGTEIKITQYADDTVLYLKDLQALQNSYCLLDRFFVCSGLKLNKEKTEAIQLGLMAQNRILPKIGIKLVDEPIKSLGIWIGKDLGNAIQKNLIEKLSKIRTIININKARNMSIKGKITFLRAMVMPNLLYIASILFIPKDFIAEIDKLFFDFIWPKGKHHVKKNVLIQKTCDGGLNMPDVHTMVKALRLTWVKRLLNKTSVCTRIAEHTSGVPNFTFLLKKKYDIENVQNVTLFYREILEEWAMIHSIEPKNSDEIAYENLWYNKRIKIGNKTVYYKSWHDANINYLYDIFDFNQGKILTWLEIQDKFDVNIKIMEYNSLISSIPYTWIQCLKTRNTGVFTKVDPLIVKLDKHRKKMC